MVNGSEARGKVRVAFAGQDFPTRLDFIKPRETLVHMESAKVLQINRSLGYDSWRVHAASQS